ncbi:MAG TPA: hypothetical protein VI873_01630 [Candidatus Peribacteraceae bacterium]|nr:hypothetical protein [Candidatus Peribacteraceae bacterium]
MTSVEITLLTDAIQRLQEGTDPKHAIERINATGQMTNFSIARALHPDPAMLKRMSGTLLQAADLVLGASRHPSLTTNQRLDALQTYANTIGRSYDISSRDLREEIRHNQKLKTSNQ